MTRQRVVIVGAGFGGLALVHALRDEPVDVLVVDRSNHHLFQPLLYQVATAALEPADIASAVRAAVRRRGVGVRVCEVTGVDFDRRLVHTGDGDLGYDVLVLAAGACTASFGVAGVHEHAFGLKTLADALGLRSHLLRQFEACDATPRLLEEGRLGVVVVGGGPTGVEMAGALAELNHAVLAKDFPQLPLKHARVSLVELGDALLPSFAPSLQRHALRQLIRRRIDVRLGTGVAEVRADGVVLTDGEQLSAGTVVWAAGVRAVPLADTLGLEQTNAGRVVVEPDCSVPGHPDVFVIGDIAAARDADGQLLPQLAPVAQQQARHVAAQLARRRRGEPTLPFTYQDKGTMATIGRRAAIAQIPVPPAGRPVVRLRGTLGWLAWLFLHIVMLIGFRNRLSVLLNWTWNFLTWDRSARLILEPQVEVEG